MATNGKNGEGQIDEDLHSRQLAVYGRESMAKMAQVSRAPPAGLPPHPAPPRRPPLPPLSPRRCSPSQARVLVVGMKGLGAEIAKNVILAGVKAVTLHDTEACELGDLSAHFYLSDEDVGKNRAEACKDALQELNGGVAVTASTEPLTEDFVKKFSVVVMTEQSLDLQLRMNEACHAAGVAYISSAIRGVFGQIFCDFGENFTVYDVNGENPHTSIVASIEAGSPTLVMGIEDERLEFEEGDVVEFSEVKGMTELNGVKARVRSVNIKQNTFEVDLDSAGFSAYVSGGIVTQVKQPKTVNMRPLSEALKQPGEFLLLDFAKFDRSPQLHVAFSALDRFVSAKGALPRPWDAEDGNELFRLAGEVNESMGHAKVDTLDETVIKRLAFTARGYLNPMAAMFGGIIGQEVIKAASGKFHPITQWLYFDCVEALPATDLTPEECAPTGSRYDPQVAVFGQAMQRKLAATNSFVVGAGALGCELLKNLALMGVGCGEGASLTVTDDDQIERSNLSRQFLFRDWDIGQAKSECAARAAKKINAALNVRPLQNRVSPDTEDVFNDSFWEGLDVVVNALDNVKARLYVDQRCVYFGRPLLESGTLGPKCNTQMVIPHVTENYGASRDPPEKEAPMCTVHSFPHNIDHTLVWARSEFEGMFDVGPKDVQKFLRDPSKYLEEARASKDVQTKQTLERCLGLLEAGARPESYEDCIAFARNKFQEHFWNAVVQLTTTFPEDAVTSTGSPFWSPPKRFPRPLALNPADEFTRNFLRGVANLKALVHGVALPDWAQDAAEVARKAAAMPVKEFKPSSTVKIETDPNATGQGELDDASVIDSLVDRLTAVAAGLPAGYQVTPVEFEKDDDTNFHMDVIAGLANLRARNYEIPEVDKFKCKLIAGRIVPAIATATALATGLVCLELYKVAAHVDKPGHVREEKKLEDFKNTFANLALPLFAIAEPMPAKKFKYEGLEWSLWDRWVLEGDLTVQEVLDWFEGKGLEAYSISCGAALLYNNIFPKHKERLGKKMSELVTTVAKLDISGARHFDVVVACEDQEGEDLDVPLVSIKYQ